MRLLQSVDGRGGGWWSVGGESVCIHSFIDRLCIVPCMFSYVIFLCNFRSTSNQFLSCLGNSRHNTENVTVLHCAMTGDARRGGEVVGGRGVECGKMGREVRVWSVWRVRKLWTVVASRGRAWGGVGGFGGCRSWCQY